MLVTGLCFGLACAAIQAFSYVFGAVFIHRYNSALRLSVFSQIVMGAFCLPVLPFCFPAGLLDRRFFPLMGLILLWTVVLGLGQFFFFSTLNKIESSRVSSLLGLKILFLALFCTAVSGEHLSMMQWTGAMLCCAAAIGMNWSGGEKIRFSGLFLLAMTIIFYSFADMLETRIVLFSGSGSILRDSFAASLLCYSVLGLFSLPFLVRFHPDWRQFVLAAPFAGAWYFSQVAIFVSFGTLGVVFSNILLSTRGIFSVFLGIAMMLYGVGKYDAVISRSMWFRRIAASILMTGGIVMYSLGS